MALNPSLYPQAQSASRMPQVGFGQSNLSPQYGGMPNQNAFTNANSAANLYSRFGGPSTGGGLPLPGSPPTPPMINMDDYLAGTRQMTPQPVTGGGYPLPSGQYNLGPPPGVNPFAHALQMYGRFRQLNPSGFQNANPNANLGSRFGGGMYTTQPVNNLAFPR